MASLSFDIMHRQVIDPAQLVTKTNKECHFGVVIHDAFHFTFLHRPRGPMDKASDFESEDCGFDPHRGQFSGKSISYSNHIGLQEWKNYIL